MSGKPKTPQVSKVTIEAKAFHDLQQAEAKYRSTFENAAEGIFQSTPGGRYLSVNPAMARIYGYETPEEMIAAVTDIAHQIYADPEMRGEFSRRLKKEGKVERFELRNLRKDGSLIWTSTNARIVRDAKGKVLFYEGFVQDITERKRVEEQIAYQAPLLAIVNDAVVASDAKNRITAWNAAAESMYGWKAEEVLGRFDVDITRTKYTGVDKAEMLRAIAERGSWRGEATQARKYGTRIPVEISSMVLRAESGQITGYVSVNRDITGRKRAEEALRKSEERYRELFENMMDGFAYCRMSFDDKDCPVDFVYLAVNTAFEQLTGLKNAVGHRITEVFPGIKEAHPELFEIYGRVAMTGQPERFEVYFKPLAMWMSIAVYSPTEGYFVTVFDDITERKRAEEALRESHARLAHLSHRLVEAQEEERRRIARELHDEVGQSLTALTISLEGVSQLALEGAMRGKIAEIQELTKNLIAEVNALSVELRPRVLDDLGLIPGLLSLFSRFSSQTGVEIDFKHTGIKRKRVTPEIEISAYRIIQEALTNVVRHADVKTTSVRLQVEADMLWIQVQDEGKGFDLQQAMKAEDSMGLLSMTERAEQVGGWLEVQTAPGEGTLITCQLPLGGSHVDKEGV